eukprot:5058662-Alexandrium_andersonii.AAC.1
MVKVAHDTDETALGLIPDSWARFALAGRGVVREKLRWKATGALAATDTATMQRRRVRRWLARVRLADFMPDLPQHPVAPGAPPLGR